MTIDWSVLIIIDCIDIESIVENPVKQDVATPSERTYRAESDGGPIRRPLLRTKTVRRFGNLVYRPNKIKDASSAVEVSRAGQTAKPLGLSRSSYRKELGHIQYGPNLFRKDNRPIRNIEFTPRNGKSEGILGSNTAPNNYISVPQRVNEMLVEKYTKRGSASRSSELSTSE